MKLIESIEFIHKLPLYSIFAKLRTALLWDFDNGINAEESLEDELLGKDIKAIHREVVEEILFSNALDRRMDVGRGAVHGDRGEPKLVLG